MTDRHAAVLDCSKTFAGKEWGWWKRPRVWYPNLVLSNVKISKKPALTDLLLSQSCHQYKVANYISFSVCQRIKRRLFTYWLNIVWRHIGLIIFCELSYIQTYFMHVHRFSERRLTCNLWHTRKSEERLKVIPKCSLQRKNSVRQFISY